MSSATLADSFVLSLVQYICAVSWFYLMNVAKLIVCFCAYTAISVSSHPYPGEVQEEDAM